MRDKRAVGFEIRTLNNMIMRKMESIAVRHGEDAPTMSHGWILGYLYNHGDEDIYQRDIEKMFKLSRSAVTSILKILEERGCIKRQSVEFDARLKKIVILPKGIEIYKMSLEDIQIMDNILERNISKEDLKAFYRVMDQAKKNLIESEQ